MRLKFIILGILLSTFFSGCGTVCSGNVEDKNNIKLTIKAEATLTQTPKPTVAYDYSEYSGEWICKDKHTNLTIEVDSNGKVDGGITTEIGDMVPTYSISGTI